MTIEDTTVWPDKPRATAAMDSVARRASAIALGRCAEVLALSMINGSSIESKAWHKVHAASVALSKGEASAMLVALDDLSSAVTHGRPWRESRDHKFAQETLNRCLGFVADPCPYGWGMNIPEAKAIDAWTPETEMEAARGHRVWPERLQAEADDAYEYEQSMEYAPASPPSPLGFSVYKSRDPLWVDHDNVRHEHKCVGFCRHFAVNQWVWVLAAPKEDPEKQVRLPALVIGHGARGPIVVVSLGGVPVRQEMESCSSLRCIARAEWPRASL